jgi:hypothetical protein
MTEARSYPRHVRTDAGEFEFCLASRADARAVLDFAQKPPTHDLPVLPRNICQPKVLSVHSRIFVVSPPEIIPRNRFL